MCGASYALPQKCCLQLASFSHHGLLRSDFLLGQEEVRVQDSGRDAAELTLSRTSRS